MTHSLSIELAASYAALGERLEQAANRTTAASPPGQARMDTDTFLAAASQHVAAAVAVLLPASNRSLNGNKQAVREFVHECKQLELTLARAKAKQYGQAQAIRRPWTDVWSDVRAKMARTAQAEETLTTLLDEQLDERDAGLLSARFNQLESRSQTRPHPYLPHRGIAGRLARTVCSRADRVWDELEGRVTSSRAPAVTAGAAQSDPPVLSPAIGLRSPTAPVVRRTA